MAWLYLDPALDATTTTVGARVGVRGEEAKHAVTVARTRVGDRLSIGNGAGLVATGAVVQAEARSKARSGRVRVTGNSQWGSGLIAVEARASRGRRPTVQP